MSETTETETAQAPTETVTPPVETGPDDLKAVLEQLGLTPGQIIGRLEAGKKNEQRAKENAEKAEKFDALEEAAKTEQQKLQERAEKAEQALAEREAKEALSKLVSEVADAKKVPAAILRGATREELEEHADLYLASLPVLPNAPSADGLGALGSTVSGSDGSIDAAIEAARSSRNFALVATLRQQKADQKAG